MTNLPTRPFARTGWETTPVGFGAWAAGGGGWSFGWGAQDDAASVAAIRRAVEVGINWIDTAAVYGLGHSEEIVAEALSGFSEADRPRVFTKAGLRWQEGDPMSAPKRVGDPTSLRTEVEASLRRLRADHIDLYQMHWPPGDDVPVEDYWGAFLEFKREGLVAAAGLSNHDVSLLERAEAVGHVDSLQPPYSLIVRSAAADVIPWCHEHETAVIVYSPMQAGLLSGSFTKERAMSLPEDDWRTRDREFSGERLEHNLALADALRPIAERHGVSVAAVSIAWTLSTPGVTGAIVGARAPDQVDGWVLSASLSLSAAELGEIAAALEATGAGSGPIAGG